MVLGKTSLIDWIQFIKTQLVLSLEVLFSFKYGYQITLVYWMPLLLPVMVLYTTNCIRLLRCLKSKVSGLHGCSSYLRQILGSTIIGGNLGSCVINYAGYRIVRLLGLRYSFLYYGNQVMRQMGVVQVIPFDRIFKKVVAMTPSVIHLPYDTQWFQGKSIFDKGSYM